MGAKDIPILWKPRRGLGIAVAAITARGNEVNKTDNIDVTVSPYVTLDRQHRHIGRFIQTMTSRVQAAKAWKSPFRETSFTATFTGNVLYGYPQHGNVLYGYLYGNVFYGYLYGNRDVLYGYLYGNIL